MRSIIDEIARAEATADEIRVNAAQTSREQLLIAREQSERELAALEKREREKTRAALEQAEADGERAAEESMRGMLETAERQCAGAEEKLPAAVAFLMDKALVGA